MIGASSTFSGSFAVRDDVAMGGHANENEMIAQPRVKVLGVALSDDGSWVASIADG